MWKWILRLLLDQRGIEDEAPAADASAVVDSGEGEATDAGVLDNGTGVSGQAGDGSVVTPKFGAFGDDPNEAAVKLFEAFTKQKRDFEGITKKSGLTERNLASLRQTLQTNGLRYNEETGQLEVVKQSGQERKTRFTDEHKSLFDGKVLEAMRLLVQDLFDESYGERERTSQEKRQQAQRFMSEKQEVEELMMGYFPQLNKDDSNFNQAFFDRATEIWHEQYNGNLLKQLSAALRAAQELKIIPQMIEQAKKEGIVKGKQEKKILSPVSGGAAGAGKAGMRVLSKEEVLALPEDKRKEYNKWRLEHPDAK